MSLKNKAKAIAKNIEGKVQEAIGDLTNNPAAQAEGQEKQAEAEVLLAAEEVNDEVQKTSSPPQNDPLETADPQVQEGTELYDSPTPDSYDPHITPAETAARKEREGDNFKHLSEHPPGSESIDTTGGFTVDKEGLVDNFAIEPEIYYEAPGDLPDKKSSETEKTDP
jgi:uncharacterized protein YjbJ (UPF0337 family)